MDLEEKSSRNEEGNFAGQVQDAKGVVHTSPGQRPGVMANAVDSAESATHLSSAERSGSFNPKNALEVLRAPPSGQYGEQNPRIYALRYEAGRWPATAQGR